MMMMMMMTMMMTMTMTMTMTMMMMMMTMMTMMMMMMMMMMMTMTTMMMMMTMTMTMMTMMMMMTMTTTMMMTLVVAVEAVSFQLLLPEFRTVQDLVQDLLHSPQLQKRRGPSMLSTRLVTLDVSPMTFRSRLLSPWKSLLRSLPGIPWLFWVWEIASRWDPCPV